jgi:N-acetylmuramic acid 6-phosphate etherase
MTNVLPRNSKLRARALRIIMAESGSDEETARAALDKSGDDPRVALVMMKTGSSIEEAKVALEAANGVIEQAALMLRK